MQSKRLKLIVATFSVPLAISAWANIVQSYGLQAKQTMRLAIEVEGKGQAAALVKIEEVTADKVSGTFTSPQFGGEPVPFSGTLAGDVLTITSTSGVKLEALLKKTAEGRIDGTFRGDFNGRAQGAIMKPSS